MKEDIIAMAREAGFNKNELAYLGDNFQRLVDLARADEREACAKVCDEHLEWPSLGPKDCAEAIRARGTNHG
jgi:hypothetical protein